MIIYLLSFPAFENGNPETCPSQAGLFAKPMVDNKNKV